jgi:hypothetical protein
MFSFRKKAIGLKIDSLETYRTLPERPYSEEIFFDLNISELVLKYAPTLALQPGIRTPLLIFDFGSF